ncbi:MAG: serine/threonine protein kinase [Myxococcales bacterium]|nr:serine/threonine protein kinase [Myxococcales bacterium]
MAEDEFEGKLAQVMATIGPMAETMVQAPRSTIEPSLLPASSTGRGAFRALEALELEGAGAEGRLRLGEMLGQGGMGIVRQAEQIALGRAVAVKTLRDEMRGEAAALELLREAWATGRLEHPNVVPVHDLGLDAEGRPVIVLKRIDGRHWGALIGDAEAVREEFGAEDLLEWNLRILVQVCNAVAFAHSHGIVHRDLKPENVMVGRFGEVYLVDWGLAVGLEDDGSGRIRLAKDATQMAGTPCYMAPEMLGGDRSEIGAQTDVYLLGGILHEIVTGQPPHQGTRLPQLLASIVRSPPSGIEGPADLVALIQEAMAYEPGDRVSGVEPFRARLQRYLRVRGSLRIAEHAGQRLETLLAELATQPGAAERMRLHGLFSECRFGFHEALGAARENASALEGLRRGAEAMARFEGRVGDPSSGLALLAGVEGVDPKLVAELEAAGSRDRAEKERLQRLDAQLDMRTGWRTRLMMVGTLGLFWTLTPLTAHFWGAIQDAGPWELVLRPIVFLGIATAIAVWGRESLTRTLINRRLVGTVLLALALQVPMAAVMVQLGIPTRIVEAQQLFHWAAITSMVALTVERRVWPAALGYLLGFALCAFWLEWRYVFMSAANLLLTINVFWIWLGSGASAAPPQSPPPGAAGPAPATPEPLDS